MRETLPQPTFIDTDDKLHRLVAALAGETLLAVDTELNSLYAYRERVCLIQLSTRSADYIIDPLKVTDMQPLAPLLASPQVEIVFHAAEYDLMCLKRDFDFDFRNLFDTMIAARVCGYKLIGLGNLLNDLVGLAVDKSHQRDNWGQRPLPPESLLYAQMDTHFLPALRDHFMAELKRLHRTEEASEAFLDVLRTPPARRETFDPEGYWRLCLPNHFTRRQAAVVRELYLLRERLAEARDVPPFKVMTDKVLTAITRDTPTNAADLRAISGISAGQVRRYGRELLDAINAGMHAKLPSPPAPEPPADPVVVERYAALREWRKLRALDRGVELDVIISKNALWMLAERAPDSLNEMDGVPGLGAWRLDTYGAEILDVLRRNK